MPPPLLELAEVTKRFGDLAALDGVSLQIRPGSVHGVLGENGAGKSTLMNVAYGLVRPDAGRLAVRGADARFRSPRDAIAAGVGMVHQHFTLAPAMTVLDNVLLGDRRAGRLLDRRAAAARLADLARRIGLPVDPAARVESLSVGQQQRVEILKALWRDAAVLILDEPTAVLTPAETGQLMTAVDRLRADGRGVVFISHKLGEVQRICDDVTVLRRGRVVFRGRAPDVSADELARQMVGRDVERVARVAIGELPAAPSPAQAPDAPTAPPVLALEHVTAPGLVDVSLEIHAGEILGIAGVDGNGQQELSEIVVGLRRPTRGRVTWSAQDVSACSFPQRQQIGIAHIPNDRKREALVPTMSVTQNMTLKAYRRPPIARRGLVSWRRAARRAQALAAQFDLRAESVDAPVASLSGGNQQKVVLARELGGADPKVIVAMNPVRGLDVAATSFVYRQLLDRRAAGAGVLLINGELDELLAVCDRVAVMYGGRLTPTDFPRTTRDEIGRLMAGVAPGAR